MGNIHVEKYYMYHKTHVKVAPVGLGAQAALVTIQEILPVHGIVEGEEADVLLLLRRLQLRRGEARSGRAGRWHSDARGGSHGSVGRPLLHGVYMAWRSMAAMRD